MSLAGTHNGTYFVLPSAAVTANGTVQPSPEGLSYRMHRETV